MARHDDSEDSFERIRKRVARPQGVRNMIQLAVSTDEARRFEESRSELAPAFKDRDLQELHARTDRVITICQAVRQAALVLDDRSLVRAVDACREQTQKQMDWLRTALDKASPQALIVG